MSLYIEDYSERAIALFGDTKSYKNKIMEIGGKFNPSLKVVNSDDRRAGYIFPKSKRSVVQQLIDDIEAGTIEPGSAEEKSNYTGISTKTPPSYVKNTNVVEVSKSDFMNLLSKVERLEQEVNSLKQQVTGKNLSKVESSKKNSFNEYKEEEEEEEEEDEKPKARLLRKK